MRSDIAAVVASDLRSIAVDPYAPAQADLAALSPYGPTAPFGSPAFAQRDAHDLTPVSVPRAPDAIPGWRVGGSLGAAQRFLLRVPQKWNGRLVVAGTPGQRSEYACDLLFGDPLLARGYAYVCSNKGQGDGAVLLAPGKHASVENVALPRFGLPTGQALSFWMHAPGHTLEAWLADFIAITEFARETIQALHARVPEAVYALGLSNGGYQVRRAIETSDLFAGALTWNAALWTPSHNVLTYLPQALEALEAGHPRQLEALGIPPDIIGTSGDSLYARNRAVYYAVTAWLHATHLDRGSSIAYGDTHDATVAESWQHRIGTWRLAHSPRVAERIVGFANTGALRCKLIEVAAEYDHLIPPRIHDEPYRALVETAGAQALRRSRLVPFAQHVDSWSELPDFPQMRTAYREVWSAFDELVNWVE